MFPLALSQEFVENAVRLLVTRFMPLNTTDLESWMADPEEWVHLEDKENDQWEYEIRVSMLVISSKSFVSRSGQACAERVLMQLCNQFPDFVVPLLATTFTQIARELSILTLTIFNFKPNMHIFSQHNQLWILKLWSRRKPCTVP